MLKLLAVIGICIFGVSHGLPSTVTPLHVSSGPSSGQEVPNEVLEEWMKSSNSGAISRFDPNTEINYHLFTRDNPTTSQPLIQDALYVSRTNFSGARRTIILLHGWQGNAVNEFGSLLISMYLFAEDVNVISVDWSIGASPSNYFTALENSLQGGVAVARFLDWLNGVTGASPSQYHIVGHGFGGHMAGIVARNVQGEVAYITALDPSMYGWVNHNQRLQAEDSAYTEVIHTNVGINGYHSALGHADFYPNGGESMPGCDSHSCDHNMSYFYFAESIASGGFTGSQCRSYLWALLQTCWSSTTAKMGGRTPKADRGIFLVWTNAAAPFSLD